MRSELGKYLEGLRGKRSLREIAERSGLSHTYIRDLELGVNRVTKTPIRPTPETLMKLSEAYKSDYNEIMRIAGYIEESKEDAYAPPKSKLDLAVERIEHDFNVSIIDDPLIMKSLENYIEELASIKKKYTTDR